MEQTEAEELAEALEMWASLADSGNDLPAPGQSMLQAAAVIRRQAAMITSLRRDLQQARSVERVLD
ncbi:hypothetical protein [Novosphingobium sp.]|uniref:hypothetical protein n=1 Tax=Novosphingobium sp. TaxID=1874826 RepID=UPI002FE01CEA